MLGTSGAPIRGPERNKRYTDVEFEAVGRFPFPDPEVEAWVRGDVGWTLGIAQLGGDDEDEVRFSLVFQLESDEWKIVFGHVSIGEREDSTVWGDPWDQETSELLDKIRDEPPDLSGTVAPDGTITLVLTDIEGSTALNTSFGDKAWLDVLRAHNQVVTATTLEHGGTVVKGLGDGFMLAFTSARTAMTASQAIQDRIAETFNDPGSPIHVRIGIHTGEALRDADDLFGHAVNYAARVAGAATGGEILVSSLTHDLVLSAGEFVFEAPRAATLKGIEGSQLVYPLERRW